jgi:predicted ATPase
LAVQVAAELLSEFPDGVWLVELAPVGQPDALADAVATVVGVTPQAGLSITASLVRALSGRRVLLVLDNCEHLLDAAANLAGELLTHTTTVRMLTTSRETLRVGGEQVWSVPSLDVHHGVASAAVTLFVERAQAVYPAFGLDDDADAVAVTEICTRLDGIPLAIELAASRMVVMSARDVRDHLGDRFRLLSGSRRGLERHQTLRQAVQWSYDLLGEDERTVLQWCSVFSGGFDLAAATTICEQADDYAVLDMLESLARKSLITVEPVGGHARYGMLETIRQFAEERLAATDTINEVRDRHATYFAKQAIAHWDLWEGPGYRAAADWVDAEFGNLRAGFRWAADRGDLATATAIAAHTTMMGFFLQLFEPIGWAEEILPAAAAADLPQLPRVYTAASLSCSIGRFATAAADSEAAVALQDDPRYDPFDHAWTGAWAAIAYGLAGAEYRGRSLKIYTDLANKTGLAHAMGLVHLLYMLPYVGRADEARGIAADAVSVARAHGNPVHIAMALTGAGRAFADTDPAHALDAFHQALVITQEQRIPFYEARFAQESAGLEAVHGDLAHGLTLFDTAIDASHRAGNLLDLYAVLVELVVFFDREAKPEVAATIYGASSHYLDNAAWTNRAKLPIAVANLRGVLGDTKFDQYVAVGAAMAPADAVAYARDQIQAARRQIADAT